MKEIFDICRFWALARKYYRENMKTILIFLGVMIIVTLVFVCGFNPFEPEYTELDDMYTEADYLELFSGKFTLIFWGLLGVFSMVVASYSFVDFMSVKKSFGALLLPASSFEKLLLVTLNSTVVILLVYLAIFYGITNAACSFKYMAYDKSDRIAYSDSWLGFTYPVLKPGTEIVHPKVINVFYFVDKISEVSAYFQAAQEHGSVGIKKTQKIYGTSFLVWNFLIIHWTYFVFMFMWGALTFRKRSVLLTIFLHGLFFLFLGWLIYRVGTASWWRVSREDMMLYELYFYNTSIFTPSSLSWLLFLYVVPLTYMGVIWKKFKNKQV